MRTWRRLRSRWWISCGGSEGGVRQFLRYFFVIGFIALLIVVISARFFVFQHRVGLWLFSTETGGIRLEHYSPAHAGEAILWEHEAWNWNMLVRRPYRFTAGGILVIEVPWNWILLCSGLATLVVWRLTRRKIVQAFPVEPLKSEKDIS
jgi:hypothetical protein